MGSRLSPAQREKLPKSDFACPSRALGAGSYLISDPSRVASAKAYYKRRHTDTTAPAILRARRAFTRVHISHYSKEVNENG